MNIAQGQALPSGAEGVDDTDISSDEEIFTNRYLQMRNPSVPVSCQQSSMRYNPS